MKKILMVLLVGVTMVGFVSGIAFAGNSASFAVSCSIPAVPGLNAPPYVQDKTIRIEEPRAEITSRIETEKPQEAKAETIQQTAQKEIELADGKTTSVEVETMYLR
jgi:hypothetical protein